MTRNFLSWETTRNALFVLLATASTVPLIVPNVNTESLLLAKMGFTALFVWIAIQDFRTQTVSPFITLPWMWMSIVRGIVERNPAFLAFWFVIFLLWSFHFYGGGDAKLLMGLFGLMPDVQLLWIVCIVLVVTGIPVLALKYWHTPPRALASNLSQRVQSGALLPTDEDLNQGVPFAFAYCIAGAVYMWIFL